MVLWVRPEKKNFRGRSLGEKRGSEPLRPEQKLARNEPRKHTQIKHPHINNIWAVIWGGAKRIGGGKRTRECALPKIFGALQKSFWSALSWISVQENRALTREGGWKTYRTRGGPKPLFGWGVIREVFHPPLFSTPPWRPLKKTQKLALG